MKQKYSLITVGDILTIVTSRRIVKTNTARDHDMERAVAELHFPLSSYFS